MKTRFEFAPIEVQKAMQGKPHRHDLVREICEKVIGSHYAVARPGKTAWERYRRERGKK